MLKLPSASFSISSVQNSYTFRTRHELQTLEEVITLKNVHLHSNVCKSYSYFLNVENNSLNENAYHHIFAISLIFFFFFRSSRTVRACDR